jgi:phosphoribosylformylglycinamidine cyclo-ligase
VSSASSNSPASQHAAQASADDVGNPSAAAKPTTSKNHATYAAAGVDITSGDRAKQRIKMLARKTFNKHVLSEIGGFGGLFALDLEKFPQPVLVSSADGVGTKLKVAFELGIHHTVGADLVNHCVNDILALGAEPLFFLDYLAMGQLEINIVEQVVEGMSRACHQVGCSLVGGETAELPGMYAPGDYDLAGFIVGVVERSRIFKSSSVRAGDILLALPSLGLHTNGYSLARKLVFEVAALAPDTYVAEISNKIGAELLMPHRCYWPMLKRIVAEGWLSGIAHITGGGIPGNLPRVLPKGMQAVIELGSWPMLPIFSYLARLGQLEREELLSTFNLGVGMILVVPAQHARSVEGELKRRREKYYRIGQIRTADARKPPVVFSGSLPL